MRRRKRKHAAADSQPAREGFFWSGLNDRLRESVIEFGRLSLCDARQAGRVALVEHDSAKLARREERLTLLLNAAVEKYAFALELFQAWKNGGQRATSRVQVNLHPHSHPHP